MAFLSGTWLMALVAVIFTLTGGIYLYFTLCYQHWKKKGIPYLEPSFPCGNLIDVLLQRKSISDNLTSIYRKLEGHKVGGFYQVNQPTLMIRDPEMIKTILVKDFAHFQDHGLHSDVESDPISGFLFVLDGIKWKHLRQKVSPSFSPVKTKRMFPIVFECGEELKAHLAPLAARNETIEVLELVARTTTDIIASCGFGIQTNSLKNPDAEFRTKCRKVLEPTLRSALRNFLHFTAPKIAAIVKMPITTRDVSEFFFGAIKETVEYREQNNIVRDDFLQTLIDIKNNKHKAWKENGTKTQDGKNATTQKAKNIYDDSGLTLEQITSQVTFFLMVGYETSSRTVSFCLYELALNQGMQERLREEINSAKADHGGKLNYEALVGMDFMDRIVLETMRKYPPLPFLPRICTKAYQLPESKVKIDLGTYVMVPTYALHHDPLHYPSPEVFDPDRFTEEAKSQRHHYVYLPFGEGPRICPGTAFSEMQVKISIAAFISNYKVSVCEKNTAIPLVMDPTAFLTAVKGGIKLKISELS